MAKKRRTAPDVFQSQPSTSRLFRMNFSYGQSAVMFLVIVIAVYIYRGYHETRVNTPFSSLKLSALFNASERLWGTYRANLHVGIRSKDPESPLLGLVWFYPEKLLRGNMDVNHWCEQYSNLERYGWTRHNGKDFAVQETFEDGVRMTSTFVSYGNEHGLPYWYSKIAVDFVDKQQPRPRNKQIAFVWYVTFDEAALAKSRLGHDNRRAGDSPSISGFASKLGRFVLKLVPDSNTAVLYESKLATSIEKLSDFKQLILSHLHIRSTKVSSNGLPEIVFKSATQSAAEHSNFAAVQIVCNIPCALDVTMSESTANEQIESGAKLLSARLEKFDRDFDTKFNLAQTGFGSAEIRFAKTVFSQLIGGISYFYGASRVKSAYTKEPVSYWKAPLLTAIPSRSFFPRGFLWDEGFHGILIADWDLDLELEIMAHWFDLMNVEGWIPREQILGSEALAKVPAEFLVQVNTNANPPAFFLTLEFILKHYRNELNGRRWMFLDQLYPRLKKWFQWFNGTQFGEEVGSYRWRGRDELTNRELNPKTLTSGLDDFPRASHPTLEERHIDLRCWMRFAAEVLADLAQFLKLPNDYRVFHKQAIFLGDQTLLDRLHWSEEKQMYADYGLHTTGCVLTTEIDLKTGERYKKRQCRRSPKLRLVDDTFGYVNLFPFFLQQIDLFSPKLKVILDRIRDPNELWTEFGLRSLSKSSPLYNKYNTASDAPYWRGNIWLNMNYLAAKALHHYGQALGPYKVQAARIYAELKTNLVRNVFRQFNATGFIWENYNETSGRGQGTKPFAGWSTLIVLIMADKY